MTYHGSEQNDMIRARKLYSHTKINLEVFDND